MLAIQDTILVSNPLSLDAFLCNYYAIGSNIKVETKEEYLLRVPRALRRRKVDITWINEPGLVSNSAFANFQNNCTISKYWFKDGIEDVDLVEHPSFDRRDQEFEFQDVAGNYNNTYTLDIEAIYDYAIVSLILFSDVDMSYVYLYNSNKGNTIFEKYDTPISANSKFKFTELIDLKSLEVMKGDMIYMNVGFVNNTGTFIRGKLVYDVHEPIVNNHSEFIEFTFVNTIPNFNFWVYFYGSNYPVDINFGEEYVSNIPARSEEASHLYPNTGTYNVIIYADNVELNSDITPSSIRYVNQKYIRSYGTQLTSIDLSECPDLIDFNMNTSLIETITGVDIISKIKEFTICNCLLSNQSLTDILTILSDAKYTNLKRVNISNNGLTKDNVPSQQAIDAFVTAHPSVYLVYGLD